MKTTLVIGSDIMRDSMEISKIYVSIWAKTVDTHVKVPHGK